VTDILATVPAVKVLATSREALNLRQEWLYPIDGLGFPTAAEVDGVEANDLETYSAVELFVGCARRANAGFSLSAEKHWVARICQLVEGMPLAVELAAAWVRHMPCQTIAQDLEKGIDVLTTSLRDVPERHRSLKAVFEQSWQLLSAEERGVLRKLSLFRGGFQREAAETVAGASLLMLSALVDKSWLRVDPSGRYDLHELSRQFAAERLQQRPAEEEETQDRHSTYYLAFLQGQERHLKGPKLKEALAAIKAEIDNVRLAWRWAIEHDRWVALRDAMESLWLFYEIQGWLLEGNKAFARAVAKLRPQYDRPAAGEGPAPPGKTGLALGIALTHQGWFQFRLGLDEQAKALVQESLAIFRAAGHRIGRETALSLHFLGVFVWFQGELVVGKNLLEESHVLFAEAGDRWGCARTLFSLGQATLELGQYAEAERLLQESKAIFDAIGEQRQVVFVISNLGRIAQARGHYAQAETLHRECLQRRTTLGDRPGISYTLGDLGEVARLQGQPTQAKEFYQQSLAIAKEMSNRTQVGLALRGLSKLAEMRGDYVEAERLIQASKGFYQLFTSDLCLGWAAFGLGDYQAAEECFYGVLTLAAERQWLRAVLHALTGLAHLLAQAGEPECALELLALILGHPASHPEFKGRAARLQAELTTEMPSDVAAAAQERGRARDLEATVAELLVESRASS
jgi:predicted ATPase